MVGYNRNLLELDASSPDLLRRTLPENLLPHMRKAVFSHPGQDRDGHHTGIVTFDNETAALRFAQQFADDGVEVNVVNAGEDGSRSLYTPVKYQFKVPTTITVGPTHVTTCDRENNFASGHTLPAQGTIKSESTVTFYSVAIRGQHITPLMFTQAFGTKALDKAGFDDFVRQCAIAGQQREN